MYFFAGNIGRNCCSYTLRGKMRQCFCGKMPRLHSLPRGLPLGCRRRAATMGGWHCLPGGPPTARNALTIPAVSTSSLRQHPGQYTATAGIAISAANFTAEMAMKKQPTPGLLPLELSTIFLTLHSCLLALFPTSRSALSLQSHSLAPQTPPRQAPPDAAPRTVAPLPPLEKPTASYYGASCVAD